MKGKKFLCVLTVCFAFTLCSCDNEVIQEPQNQGQSQSLEVEKSEQDKLSENEEAVISNSDDSDKKTFTYIGNANTLKFHRLNCRNVSQMSDKNKVYFNETREEIISKGYKPCKHCKP